MMNISDEYYSPDQVAEQLGLHVKTVRRFIKEGKLPALRVGKQYRITDGDLQMFVGNDARKAQYSLINRRRRVLVSTTIDIDAIDVQAQERLVALLVGAFHSLENKQNRRRFDSIYYEEEGRLRLIVNADLDLTNAVLGMIRGVLED